MGFASMIAQLVQQGYSDYMSYGEDKMRIELAERNAAIKEQEAKSIEKTTGFAQSRSAEAGERISQTQQTQIGASGGVSSLGTSRLAQATQRSENELKTSMIGYEGSLAASRARSEAEAYRLEAKIGKFRNETRSRFWTGGTSGNLWGNG